MPVVGGLRADVHLARGGGAPRYSREEHPRARNGSCRPARNRPVFLIPPVPQLKQCLDARINICCGVAPFAASTLMDVHDRRLADQPLAGRRLEIGGASVAQVAAT
jgi:hypothetical protein